MAVISALYGAFALGFLIGGGFFFRLWRGERQPLLGFFAAAFVLLAINYGLLGAMHLDEADKSQIYLIRCAAFLVIIAGIAMANVRRDDT